MLPTLIVAVCTALPTQVLAGQNDSLERQIRADQNYEVLVANARIMLQARGYEVQKINAFASESQKYLKIAAFRGADGYDIRLEYPSLKIKQEKKDR